MSENEPRKSIKNGLVTTALAIAPGFSPFAVRRVLESKGISEDSPEAYDAYTRCIGYETLKSFLYTVSAFAYTVLSTNNTF